MEYVIEQGRRGRQPYAAVRTTVEMDKIGEVMGPLYGELFGWLGQKGITPAGAPWSRYLEMGLDEIEFEVAAPLADEVVGDGRIIGGVMPACDYASTMHVGPYDEIEAAYTAVLAWLAEKNLKEHGAMWEVYLTDPSTEPDPAKWRTMVYYPTRLA